MRFTDRPPTPGRAKWRRLTALRRLCRSEIGTTAIETAFLLPVFLTFVIGIMEFGRAMWIQSSLQYAVEAAARCAVVQASSTCSSTTAVQTYAAAAVIGPSVSSGDFTVATSGTCGSSTGNPTK